MLLGTRSTVHSSSDVVLADRWRASAIVGFATNGSPFPMDLVSGQLFTQRRAGSSYQPIPSVDLRGPSLLFPNTSAGLIAALRRGTFGDYGWLGNGAYQNPFVFFIHARLGTSATGQIIGRYHNAAVHYDGAWQLRKVSGALEFRYIWQDSDGNRTIVDIPMDSNGALPSGTLLTIVGYWDGERIRIYRDGQKILDAAAPPSESGHGYSTRHTGLRLGADTANYNTITGSHYMLAGLMNTTATEDELCRLSDDPYSFIAPRTARIYYIPSAVGGVPTLSTPFASSITANSVTPNVTVTF